MQQDSICYFSNIKHMDIKISSNYYTHWFTCILDGKNRGGEIEFQTSQLNEIRLSMSSANEGTSSDTVTVQKNEYDKQY